MNSYNWYKSHGICPRCGQADAVKGKVFCLNCLDRQAVAAMVYRSSHDTTESNRVRCRERYRKARETGICVRCYQNKAREGKATCQICFSKIREKQAIYQRLKRMEGNAE